MWPKGEVEYPADVALQDHLADEGVRCTRLPLAEHRNLETAWRRIYQRAFLLEARFRHGERALDEYLQETETTWLLVPFLSGVPGTAVHVRRFQLNAFKCEGRLLPLDDFINVEFFVSPRDLKWTLVRTHEDFALGGPYFARSEPVQMR